MLNVVHVDIHNDLLDWLTFVVGALTAGAAIVGLALAIQDARKATREARSANLDAQEARDETARLRDRLKSTDQLLRSRAYLEVAATILDSMENPGGDTPTYAERQMARRQTQLASLPEEALPKLRDAVDNYEPLLGRRVSKGQREYTDLQPGEIEEEVRSYVSNLRIIVAELENNPDAVDGIISAV